MSRISVREYAHKGQPPSIKNLVGKRVRIQNIELTFKVFSWTDKNGLEQVVN